MQRIVLDVFPMSMALSCSGDWVGIGGNDGTLKLKSLHDLQEQNTRAHSGDIKTISFGPNDAWVLTGGKGELIKWELKL